MKRILLVFLCLIALSDRAQIINTSFIASDTVCINQTFTIQNTSTGSINSTYWNFCTSSVALTGSVNLGASASSFPVFMTIQEDAGNYYAFVSHNFPGGMSRFDFGNNLGSIPTSTNLGNPGGQMPGNSEGIVIEKEGSNWYGVVVGGPVGTISRMNFGASLVNTPTVVSMGNIGTLAYPHRLRVIHAAGNKYGFTVNRNSNTITRLDFGNSLNNVPVGTNLGNIGSLNGPNDFDIVYVNGNWHMFVTNDGNNTLVRLDFGNSLLNTPTGTNLGTIGVSPLRGISIDLNCGGIRGQVTSQGNNFYNLNFPTGPTGIPNTTFVGNATFSFPHSIQKYRVNDIVYAFVPNANSNSLSRLTYTNCTASIANSTLSTLPPITFTATGIYTITLLNNSNQFNQSVYCKTIAVMGNTIGTSASPSVGCSAGFTTTLTVNGNGTFTWDPGPIIGNTVVVTPTASTIYTASTSSTLNCGNSQTLAVSVITTPTLNVSATNFTICAGGSTSLSANGASGYTWTPGNIIASSFTISPSSTTVYTVVGANGICNDTQTIQIVVDPNPTVNVSPNPGVMCLNSAVTLTASGATNYTWSPNTALSSTNTPVTTGNPTVSTVYAVTGSLGSCTAITTCTIAVLPLPTVVVSQPSQTICSNNSAVISATGATTYTWNPGNIVGGTVTVSPVSNTIYTVIGTAGTCTGAANATIDVIASPTVNLNSTSPNICSGSSATLTANGASNYTWNPGALTGSNVVVTPTATTVYTAVGSNGICSDTKTIQIDVAPVPTISAFANYTFVCLGESATLAAIGAQTYTWSPGNLNGSPVFPTPTVNTTYTVVGTNSVGCTNTAAVSVTVGTNPSVSVVGPGSVAACFGTTTGFVATGAINYTWNPGPSFLNILSTVAIANTVYTVTGAVGSCTNSATATLIVNPLPTITAVASPSLRCLGSSGATTLSASGANSYTWVPALYMVGPPSGPTVMCTPPVSICYNVGGTNSFGCYSTAVVCVTVQPTPTVNINSIPGVICIGDQGSLEGSGATSYTWLPTSSNNTNIIVTPTTTTTYTLYGQTGACTGSIVSTVTVNPYPNLVAVVSDPTICLGKSTDIFASGATTYTWQPLNIFGSSVNVAPNVSTIYTVSGTSLNCSVTKTIDVNVVPNPYISIFVSPAVTCLDPSKGATLTAGGASTYTWLPNSSTSQSISVLPTTAANYTAIGLDSSGCVSSSTIALEVDPDLHKSVSDTLICEGRSIDLTASGASTYLWMPGSFYQQTINVSPGANTVYTVIATNGLCSKTGTINVEVIQHPIQEIPEVFTPNDDGKNDKFVIRSEALTKIDIKVFNRWGALVYSNAEYDNTWDGTANAGMVVGNNKLPQGTYYYVIDLESCDKQSVRGYVVIQY